MANVSGILLSNFSHETECQVLPLQIPQTLWENPFIFMSSFSLSGREEVALFVLTRGQNEEWQKPFLFLPD